MKIKICGISRDEDARYINEAMPDLTGFIVGYPKSRRNISEETAQRLRGMVDERVKTVGVFVDYPAERIAGLANSGAIDIVQLHGSEDEEFIKRLRGLCKAPIWRSFIVKGLDDIEQAQRSSADMVLLDGGLGGGKSFDHALLRSVDREYILAGGLNLENIRAAMDELRPYALDVSSGAETNGFKDREKILRIVAAVREHSI